VRRPHPVGCDAVGSASDAAVQCFRPARTRIAGTVGLSLRIIRRFWLRSISKVGGGAILGAERRREDAMFAKTGKKASPAWTAAILAETAIVTLLILVLATSH